MLSAQGFIESISDASSLSLEADEFNELISKAVAEAAEMEAEAAAAAAAAAEQQQQQQMAAPSPTPSVTAMDDNTSTVSDGSNTQANRSEQQVPSIGSDADLAKMGVTPPGSVTGSARRRDSAVSALTFEELESAGGSSVAEAAASGELSKLSKGCL